MANFTKKESELDTRLDKWLYFIKYLEDFQNIPTIFADKVFEQAIEKAELSNLRQAELDKYEYSLKVFRDNKAVYDYAIETAYDEGKMIGEMEGMKEGMMQGIIEGKIEGILESKIEISKKLKDKGLDIDIIIDATGLNLDEIKKL